MIDVAPIWLPERQQQNYRAVLEAVARPGHCEKIYFENDGAKNDGVDQEQPAFIALLASLLDNMVNFSDPHGLVSQDNLSLLQTQSALAEQADFILLDGNKFENFQPKLGTLPSPELSATLVVVTSKITSTLEQAASSDLKLRLSGPGVNGFSHCAISGLQKQWLEAREQWVSHFPLGVDLLLVDDSSVMALPRTTKVEII